MKLDKIIKDAKRDLEKSERMGRVSVYAIPEVNHFNEKRFIQKMCQTFGVNIDNTLKKRGTMDESDIRHVIRYFLRHAYKMNLKEIAKQTGNVSHSAIINSIHECENLKNTSEPFRERVEFAVELLTKHGILK